MHAAFAPITIAKAVSGRRARQATGTVDSSASVTPSALGLPQDGSPSRTGATELNAMKAASSASPVPCTGDYAASSRSAASCERRYCGPVPVTIRRPGEPDFLRAAEPGSPPRPKTHPARRS